MRIHLVGADLEENLGIGVLAAAVEQRGHETTVVPFNEVADLDATVERALRGEPDVVGLSIQFQHRARDFLVLARRLRLAGYRGHVTTGGQFPTLAWRETLDASHGIDSVVLHDGEETLPELLAALERGTPVGEVRGLALRGADGAAVRTAPRRLLDDLDAVPFAKRYRAHDRHMGVPFVPVIGGRGCWGECSYCSIIAFYEDAIEAGGGGRSVRMRSPENVAAEMALLLERAQGRAIFCFHDDNFVFPSPRRSIERVRAIRAALDGYGVGRVAIVAKARPDCLTPELARELADLGVIRLYVGVENGSKSGGAHLGRGRQQARVDQALAACREAGIFVCYNLLVFEPEATLADVRDNVRFIREHADHPVNFCRAEPYYGTSLQLGLAGEQDLGGSYLGFNYRIADDRTELLFRICSAAFRERNFATHGLANRYMSLGYAANVVRRFHDVAGNTRDLVRRARATTRRIALDTADFLDRAIDLAERVDLADRESIERETALLGLAIAASDRFWHEELDELYAEMRQFVDATPAPMLPLRPSARFRELKRGMAVGLSVAMLQGCDGCSDVENPGGGGSGQGGMVADPLPGDAGTGGQAGMPVDPPPPDGGMGGFGGSGGAGAGGVGGDGGMPVDPPPQDAGISALEPPAAARTAALTSAPRRLPTLDTDSASRPAIDRWHDTSATAVRTNDLALFDPPKLELTAERVGDEVHVRLVGATTGVSTRWEADGEVIGAGAAVRWRPRGAADRIRVAIRSRGGVAVLSLTPPAASPRAS